MSRFLLWSLHPLNEAFSLIVPIIWVEHWIVDFYQELTLVAYEFRMLNIQIIIADRQ